MVPRRSFLLTLLFNANGEGGCVQVTINLAPAMFTELYASLGCTCGQDDRSDRPSVVTGRCFYAEPVQQRAFFRFTSTWVGTSFRQSVARGRLAYRIAGYPSSDSLGRLVSVIKRRSHPGSCEGWIWTFIDRLGNSHSFSYQPLNHQPVQCTFAGTRSIPHPAPPRLM